MESIKNVKLMKLLLGLILIISLIFTYQYQKPLMTSGEAIIMAVEHLKSPPKQWKAILASELDLQKIPPEDITLSLSTMDGFYNKITNKMQWNVTKKYNSNIQTVRMNAYTGEFIDIYGPLN